MGVSKTQHERVLSDVSQILYQKGVAPTTDMILRIVSDFFSQFPAGAPLPIPYDHIGDGAISNVDDLNLSLAHFIFNFEVLYEACLEQVDTVLQLNQTLQNKLAHLKVRRNALASRVQDYLLAQFNTDGYFMSLSDIFVDTTLTDLNMTSAFIDTSAQQVTLPAISNDIVRVAAQDITFRNKKTTVENPNAPKGTNPKAPLSSIDISPIQSAFNNVSGSAWSTNITSDTTDPVTMVVNFALGVAGGLTPPEISRIEFTPYGVTPTQVFFASAIVSAAPATTVFTNFGGKIAKTAGEKVIFSDTPQAVGLLQMVLRKDTYDYIDHSTGKTLYHYIFGAKDIGLYRYSYDNSATFVSVPLSIPESLTQDQVIDAVSLTVEDFVPPDSSITYYVANDPNPSLVESLGDLNWRPISPLSDVTDPNNIVHFDGAQAFSVFIRSTPESSADLQLIALDDTSADPTQLNPTPTVIPDVDVYRLTTFSEDVLTTSLLLEEGINSTRIYFTDYNVAAVAGLDFWKTAIDNDDVSVVYGHIDSGNDFFFGDDVGSAGKSVYVETFLEVPADIDTVLGELRKSDPNSQTWDVRVLQNGRDLGFLGIGTNTAQIPWKFQQGLNHISLLINIPPATVDFPNPQVGTINLLGTGNLYDYGTVKLDTWSYVDFFDLQYNQTGTPSTFSFFDGEIVSRKKPTTNFRLGYNKATQTGPQAIRFRADLARSDGDPSTSPFLKTYRMRFAYASQGDQA